MRIRPELLAKIPGNGRNKDMIFQRQKILENAKNRKRESKNLEFKSKFDPTSLGEWAEIIKDIVAISNSGGGIIVFGLTSIGEPVEGNVSAVKNIDPAQITDRIARYTGEQFDDFDLIEVERNGVQYPAILVLPATIPLVFVKPGTYDLGEGKQGRAFSQGTVYFRHGAKSEPATGADLQKFIENRIETTRQSWMNGIRKVVEAPLGSEIRVENPLSISEKPGASGIRIGTDPNLPVIRIENPDKFYKHRQIEVVNIFNERIKPNTPPVGYDIQCVRKLYNIDDDPKYFWRPSHSSPQYSDAFIEWLEMKYNSDPTFFRKARRFSKKV